MSRSRKKMPVNKDSTNTYGKKLSARTHRSNETRVLKSMINTGNFELEFPHRFTLVNPWEVNDIIYWAWPEDGEWYTKAFRK